MTLWPWPLTLRVSDVQCFSWPTHIPIYIILQLYRFLSYKYWIFDHISIIWNSHCTCGVSRDPLTRAKIVHIFEIPDPNLPIHFVTFRVLRRRLSHVIGKNSVFPLWRQKSSLRMRITWTVHRRSAKTTRNSFLTPNCLFTIQFYGATMTITGCFILEHPHVKAIFGRKKNCAVKIDPQNGGFWKV